MCPAVTCHDDLLIIKARGHLRGRFPASAITTLNAVSNFKRSPHEKYCTRLLYFLAHGNQVKRNDSEMTTQFEKHPFLLPAADVAAALKTNVDNGLTSTQVAQLQNEYPTNELDIQGSISWHSILAKQLFNAMILGKCRIPTISIPSS